MVRYPPDVRIQEDYLHRWHIFRSRLFSVYLHHIMRSDFDRVLHDHPADNISIVLVGGYREARGDGSVSPKRLPGDVVGRLASTPHRLIICPTEGPALTLFIMGPLRRVWGFYCPAGWRPWTDYVDPNDRYAIGKGCD